MFAPNEQLRQSEPTLTIQSAHPRVEGALCAKSSVFYSGTRAALGGLNTEIIMRRIAQLSVATLAAAAAVFAPTGEAKACGGCFHDPTDNPSVVTDHRMILTISENQTTLYDQVKYQGDPKSFAWVLPIHGNVKVGLSADVVFASLDALTATQVRAPQLNCPAPPSCPSDDSSSYGGSADAGAATPSDGVTVTKNEVVGPYESVQLSATSPAALENWLTTNHFVVPADVKPIVDAYQREGFDFLALKLLPGQGVQSMRPVRITMPGASPTLPLRMVSAGTGLQVGITLFVIADGRYEPANFPSFLIKDDELVWDWSTNMSNYRTLRTAKEVATKNHAWELESSMGVPTYAIQNAVLSGGRVFNGGFGGGPSGPPEADYSGVPATDGGAAGATAAQVRDADMAALLEGQMKTPRITRLRTDLAHDALSVDLSLNASQDQSEVSNLRQASKDLNRPPCPTYAPCALGLGGVVGAGCAAQPQSSTGDVFLLGGLGLVGIVIARRRRRNAA